MRARQLCVAGVLALACVAACNKAAKSPNATEAECEQYRNKLFSLMPASERESMTNMGMQKATKVELQLCMQRVTSEEVACAERATTQEAALACKPSVDIRPPEARRTPEECAAYREHVTKLADIFEANDGAGPPLTKAMAAMMARECERWMTKSRYDCVMKSGSPMDVMTCRP